MKSPKPATDTIYPHIKFWWYRTMLNFYPPFLCRVLAAILKMADILKILKMQNCSSNGDLSLVKFYVSIIIQLEVININVRNFKFPIGFYSNPHPFWTPEKSTPGSIYHMVFWPSGQISVIVFWTPIIAGTTCTLELTNKDQLTSWSLSLSVYINYKTFVYGSPDYLFGTFVQWIMSNNNKSFQLSCFMHQWRGQHIFSTTIHKKDLNE